MMIALLNGYRSKRIEQIAVPEFSGDSEHRLQHLGSNAAASFEPRPSQRSGLIHQLFFFAGTGHERDQLLTKQHGVVAFSGFRSPSQGYRFLAEFLADEPGPFFAQGGRHAFTL